MVKVENACVDVGGRQIIKDFSFELYPGEKLGIAGRNGTGKSTLLDVLVGARGLASGTREVRQPGCVLPLMYFNITFGMRQERQPGCVLLAMYQLLNA